MAIAALVWFSIYESGGFGAPAPRLKPPPVAGYESPASAVAGYIGNMMRHRTQAACRYSLPGYQGICAMAVGAMFLTGSKVTGSWSLGDVVVHGNRAIVDVEFEACLGSDCLTNTDPNAGLPGGAGTSFSAVFRENLASFNYATDCVRLRGRWYVDIVSGPAPRCAPSPCPSQSHGLG